MRGRSTQNYLLTNLKSLNLNPDIIYIAKEVSIFIIKNTITDKISVVLLLYSPSIYDFLFLLTLNNIFQILRVMVFKSTTTKVIII